MSSVFKWGTVTDIAPLRVRIDGDTAELPVTPDSLIDPTSLVVGDRVRCELAGRRLIVHGRQAGSYPLGEWAIKGGPTSYYAPYVNVWDKGLDSGRSLDAHTNPASIVIGEDGIYEVIAVQRGTTSSDYIGIALNGNRSALETRTTGVWSHDHASGANSFSTSRYLGHLNAGELITSGAYTGGTGILQGSASHIGTLQVRRIS